MPVATGAVIVIIDVTACPPGVTDVGENAQVGVGAGPVTMHDSCTALANVPCSGAIVIVSVTCAPAFTVKLAAAGVKLKSGVVELIV
jgi:hypothetical protein